MIINPQSPSVGDTFITTYGNMLTIDSVDVVNGELAVRVSRSGAWFAAKDLVNIGNSHWEVSLAGYFRSDEKI